MCTPSLCPKDCTKLAHIAGTDEARAKVWRECACDPDADRLSALITEGIPQREASGMLWPECRRAAS